MSRNENVDHALERARKARARLAPAAARVKPLAGKAGAVAARRVRRSRSWAAPQVKRAGEVLQDSVAPKVSAMMSSAADRIDPDQPQRVRGSGATGIARLWGAARAAIATLRGARRAPASADAAGTDGADAAGTADTIATPAGDGLANQPATAADSADEAGSRARA